MLKVLPTSLAVRRTTEAILVRTGVLLGSNIVSFGWLVETFLELGGISPGAGRPLLFDLVRQLVLRDGQEPSTGYINGLISLWSRLSGAGEDWQKTVNTLNQSNFRETAEGFSAYRRRLAELDLLDPQARTWEAVRICRESEWDPRILWGETRVRVLGVDELSPAQLALVREIAGQDVDINLAYVDYPVGRKDFAGLGEEIIRPLRPVPDQDLGRLVESLVGLKPGPVRLESGLSRFIAPGRYREIEEVGARIRGFLDQGVAPRSIGVGLRTIDGMTGQMIDDVCRRYRIPLDLRRGQPLTETGPVKTLLSRIDMGIRGESLAGLLSLVESGYLETEEELFPGDLLACLQQTRILPGKARQWRSAVLNLQSGQHGVNFDNDIEKTIIKLENVLEGASVFQTPRPPRAFLQKLREMVAGMIPAQEPTWLARRDRAGLVEIEAGFDELEFELTRSGLIDQPMEPKRFREILWLELLNRSVTLNDQDPSGVIFFRLEDVAGLRFDHLFLPGLTEGIWPPPVRPEPLLSEKEKIRLNTGLGMELFRTVKSHQERELRLFLTALTAGQKTVCLSHHTRDQSGRETIGSPLWWSIDRILAPGSAPVVEVSDSFPPNWVRVLAEDELLSRMAVDWSQGLGQQVDTIAPSLGPRWSSIIERAGIEVTRDSFLRTSGQEPDRYLGCFEQSNVTRRISESYSRSPENMNYQRLEAYSTCPFRYFAENLLGLVRPDKKSMGPDARDQGILIHNLLQGVINRSIEIKCFPLPGDELESVITLKIESWKRREFRGHPALVQSRIREARATLIRFLAWESESRLAGWEPIATERELDQLTFESDSGISFPVRIRADRIDQGSGGVRVIDYKTGGTKWEMNRLIKEANVESFQLPLYLASLKAGGRMAGLKLGGRYLNLKECTNSPVLDWTDDRDRELHRAVNSILNGILAGRFDLTPQKPKECASRCGLLRFCRFRSGINPEEGGDE